MKNVITICSIISLGFLSICFIQASEGMISWSPGCYLSWNDFMGKAPNTSSNDAVSELGISYKFIPENKSILIVAVFDPNKSWVRDGHRSFSLLNHEQGHFDLNEIFACKLRQKLKSVRFKKKNFHKDFIHIYNQNREELDKTHALYDLETNYSNNDSAQTKWAELILKQLNELDEWNNQEVILVFK